MDYQVTGYSESNGKAEISAKSNLYSFGVKSNQHELAGPAEILLSAFAACCLKNVERFSSILHYSYNSVRIEVTGSRQEKPSMITEIHYRIHISSDDAQLNLELLHKNLKKFGTIYNTLNAVCKINGQIVMN